MTIAMVGRLGGDTHLGINDDDSITSLWRGQDGGFFRDGAIYQDDTYESGAPHEFGNIMGDLPDRYIKKGPDAGKPIPGWEGNVMTRDDKKGTPWPIDIVMIMQNQRLAEKIR